MLLSVSENIRKYRKDMGLTQEQLSERLSVSTATVSKWENGVASPDIVMLARLADFFDVSVDVLIGYKLKHQDADNSAAMIRTLTRERKYKEGISEAEDALKRYPHNFRILFESANLYKALYITSEDIQDGRRALELLNRSLDFLSQNNDEHVGTLSIHRDIASVYSLMGNRTESVAEYKKYNYSGINDAYIAQILSDCDETSEESFSYITDAMIRSVAERNMIVISAVNVLNTRKKYPEAISLLQWEVENIRGLMPDNAVTYYDRMLAIALALLSILNAWTDDRKNMTACIHEAYQLADKFDKDPTYDMSKMKFAYTNMSFFKNAYDSFGSTAIDIIDQLLKSQSPINSDMKSNYEALIAIWNDACRE
ncbi:MAG: helix-turn-helix domain-containing protein [Butyrivibrio sp.]|jgi:transcriptional regulator with XRE-family HTH domain|nr:helix-turn-helix domain-containing protein [Butyrivibrio sp.]